MKGSGDMSARDDRAKSGANGKAAVKPRVKREPPLRGGPVRNVTMAFRSPDPAAPESGAASSAPPPVEGPRGVVEQAVATAYRVFEEYMQRGRQAAHRQHQTEETGGPMRQQDPAAMAMQYWTNMAQTWFGAMAPFMAWGMPGMPGAGRTWDQGGPMAGAPPATTVGHRLALAVEVTSPHPTEVRVSLHDQRSALKPLRVQDSRDRRRREAAEQRHPLRACRRSPARPGAGPRAYASRRLQRSDHRQGEERRRQAGGGDPPPPLAVGLADA